MTTNSSAPAGFLIIDKPAGVTSHDVVDQVRRITGVRRVGHAGTLDPFATGILIVGVGREATKRLSAALRWPKEYEAEIMLGGTSDTDDVEGTIEKIENGNQKIETLTRAGVVQALQHFLGDIEQIPPSFAAIKVGGKKLYEYARAGEDVERKPRRVVIHELELLSYAWPIARIRVVCGSGTYIRALARDIGERLRVGGYLTALRRTMIGPLTLEKAIPLAALEADSWAKRLLPATWLNSVD